MSYNFPRTQVEGLSLSRMIIGTNWMAGYSHTGPAADNMIKERHSDTTHLVPMFKTFLDNCFRMFTGTYIAGIDADLIDMTVKR